MTRPFVALSIVAIVGSACQVVQPAVAAGPLAQAAVASASHSLQIKPLDGVHLPIGSYARLANGVQRFAPDAPADGKVASGDPTAHILDLGRQLTAWYWAGNMRAIWSAFAPSIQQKTTLDDERKFHDSVMDQLGDEMKMLSEQVTPKTNSQTYRRVAWYKKALTAFAATWSIDHDDHITGYGFFPATDTEAYSPYLDYQTKTKLRLPFNGEWYVAWGGRAVKQNYHAAYTTERFAYDIYIVKGQSTHDGDGSRNEQYYAYGQPLLAAASGKVVEVVDGIPDNRPGVENAAQSGGNHVVIEHGNGEWSEICHMQPGSLRIKLGDTVKAGQIVGQCGNSGHTSEPHLHFHLMNTATENAQTLGLPAQFQDYLANGLSVSRGEPLQGQLVRPATTP